MILHHNLMEEALALGFVWHASTLMRANATLQRTCDGGRGRWRR
jgi:hypothetical protein